MSARVRLEDAILRALNGQPEDAPIPPKPSDLPDDTTTVSVPVVTEAALFNARQTAAALDTIASGWPELTRSGFRDYLTDAAAYLEEFATAIEAQQAVI